MPWYCDEPITVSGVGNTWTTPLRFWSHSSTFGTHDGRLTSREPFLVLAIRVKKKKKQLCSFWNRRLFDFTRPFNELTSGLIFVANLNFSSCRSVSHNIFLVSVSVTRAESMYLVKAGKLINSRRYAVCNKIMTIQNVQLPLRESCSAHQIQIFTLACPL